LGGTGVAVVAVYVALPRPLLYSFANVHKCHPQECLARGEWGLCSLEARAEKKPRYQRNDEGALGRMYCGASVSESGTWGACTTAARLSERAGGEDALGSRGVEQQPVMHVSATSCRDGSRARLPCGRGGEAACPYLATCRGCLAHTPRLRTQRWQAAARKLRVRPLRAAAWQPPVPTQQVGPPLGAPMPPSVHCRALNCGGQWARWSSERFGSGIADSCPGPLRSHHALAC
jgi:hypothetical protein